MWEKLNKPLRSHYYPYTFSEAAIGGEESASITWGSGSSGGQAHLRWNWVEFSILTPECKRPYFQADVVPADAMVYLNAGKSDAFGRRTCAAASLSLTQRASALANEESFDPSEVARPQWHNLAFADSDASFDSPPGFDPDSQAVIFNQDTDASIDVDALGFQYSGNFAVELVVKPGRTQVNYAGIFGDHDCTSGHVGMVCQQRGGSTNTCAATCSARHRFRPCHVSDQQKHLQVLLCLGVWRGRLAKFP